MGRVFVLCYGDKVVIEMVVICVYLVDVFFGVNLFVFIELLFCVDYYCWFFFGLVLVEIVLMWIVLGDVKMDIDYKFFVIVEDVVEILCGVVFGKDFFVGDYFIVVDVIIGGIIMWGFELVFVLLKYVEFVDYWSKIVEWFVWKCMFEGDERDKLI